MTGPGSTQTHALGLLRGASQPNSSAIPPGFEGGFVVYSWEQKEGHGQHQRPWQHSGEALALTVAWPLQKLVCLGLPPGHSPPWPLWLSVVIRDALSKWLGQRLSEPLELKWPNDLLLGGGKVAGVLVQQCQSAGQTWVVAGVGVNLRWNQPPPDGLSAAGLIQSLPNIHREEVLEHLLEAIGQLSFQTAIDADEMAARFNAFHRYQLMSVEFIDREGRGLQSEGRVQGVSPRGGLLLELPGQEVHEYSLGALSMREAKPA